MTNGGGRPPKEGKETRPKKGERKPQGRKGAAAKK